MFTNKGGDYVSKKIEKETINKIKKLSSVIDIQTNLNSSLDDGKNDNSINNNQKGKKQRKKNKNSKAKTFKTSEVACLIVITVIVGLTLGSLFTYKAIGNKGELVEDELQDFINDYNYIVNNYNGDIDKKELLDSALEGMLNALDKNSVFLDSEAAKNFNIYLDGGYKGIGIERSEERRVGKECDR